MFLLQQTGLIFFDPWPQIYFVLEPKQGVAQATSEIFHTYADPFSNKSFTTAILSKTVFNW